MMTKDEFLFWSSETLKIQKSVTHSENIPQLCASCHENQTKMQAWYYGIQTDRFDTYKNSYHYKAIILGGGKYKSLATCNDCHENHNTKNESDPSSAIYSANFVKTCEKEECHSEQKALIYGGKVHEGQSVYLSSTKIDMKHYQRRRLPCSSCWYVYGCCGYRITH